ncbi:hypothetical protein BDP27DRAFT_510908 [Rhodocollybia butyracea]|uniref:Zinc finger RING-type eukaryotic domain-containing protein n=1 Tax=Rhodocollybia butyracea TaxID=206335 RepID=A0A9P5PYG0_9AGAR|nr:hypothetical protein BDP27DRAFT_510908 [Rhodocollybia butyracea]
MDHDDRYIQDYNNNTEPQDHDQPQPGPSFTSTRSPPQNTTNGSAAPSSPFNYFNNWNAFDYNAFNIDNHSRQYLPLPRHPSPNPPNNSPPHFNPYDFTSHTPSQMPNFHSLSPEAGSWWYNIPDGAGAAGPSGNTADSANTLFAAYDDDDELDELEYDDDDGGGSFNPPIPEVADPDDDEETIHMQDVSDQLMPPQNSAHWDFSDAGPSRTDDAVDEKNILPAQAKGKGKQKAVVAPSPTPNPSQSDSIPATILSAHALSTYTCPICFCPPTNATMTPCGHVACGSCLFTRDQDFHEEGGALYGERR